MRHSIRRRGRPAAYGITTAGGSHLDDVTKRQKQYAATMAFRVVAILVVVLVPGLTVLERVILGLVATIIPYVAVIRANGGPDNGADPTNLMAGGPRQNELPAAGRSIDGGRRVDAAEPDGTDGAAASDGAAVAAGTPDIDGVQEPDDADEGGFAHDPRGTAGDDVTERQPHRR
ncbi:MAG TPA: DUF3099 domain-containing protein [Actinospica sp.]|nr:DUF3099 domain-containing protein [Actinospica sp.]